MSHFDRGTDAKVEEARTRASSRSRRTDFNPAAFAGHRRTEHRVPRARMHARHGGRRHRRARRASGSRVASRPAAGVVKFGPINPGQRLPGLVPGLQRHRGRAVPVELRPELQRADPGAGPQLRGQLPGQLPGRVLLLHGRGLADRQRRQRRPRALHDRGHLRRRQHADRVRPHALPHPRRPRARAPSTRSPTRTASTRSSPGDDGDDLRHRRRRRRLGQLRRPLRGPGRPVPEVGHRQARPTTSATRRSRTRSRAARSVTNFVKIEGPNVGGAGNPNPCPGSTPTTSPDCIYTDLFSILGKESTRGGVEVARATYSLAADCRREAADRRHGRVEGRARTSSSRTRSSGTGRRFQVTPLDDRAEPLLHAPQRPGRAAGRGRRRSTARTSRRRSSRSRSPTTSSARRCTTPTPTSCTCRRSRATRPMPLTGPERHRGRPDRAR